MNETTENTRKKCILKEKRREGRNGGRKKKSLTNVIKIVRTKKKSLQKNERNANENGRKM